MSIRETEDLQWRCLLFCTLMALEPVLMCALPSSSVLILLPAPFQGKAILEVEAVPKDFVLEL
jgi:hypothetical protein